MEMKIKIEKTKSGLPALWECGGGYSNTGDATIVAGVNGLPKKAVYVKRSGHLANGRHALIVIEPGDHLVEVEHHRVDYWIRIFKIKAFDTETEFALTELLYELKKGEWDHQPPSYLQPAITAGIEKATCYHCRSAHYIKE